MPAPAAHTAALPQLHGIRLVTDGGMETDLIYHHGVSLPKFAAFPSATTTATPTLHDESAPG